MALVFKIKHQETLRRWVVSESADLGTFSATLGQLKVKVRELFQLPPTALLSMTYADKENDVVTLGDDHDLVDACLVQRLNPLRLEVKVLNESNTSAHTPRESSDSFNRETFLKPLFSQPITEIMQGYLHGHALPIGRSTARAEDGFKESSASAKVPNHHKPGPNSYKHHPEYEHPWGGMHCKSMPNREDYTSAEGVQTVSSIHIGVQCDGCGVNPIRGFRYKANETRDFDLCSSCFEELGEPDHDYEKMGRAESFGRGHPHIPYCSPPFLDTGTRPAFSRDEFAHGPFGWNGFPGDPFECDLLCGHCFHVNADFVTDVTICNGTELAPGTKFRKIWRMSNSGCLVWPPYTQLVYVGGDVLGSKEAVISTMPENGSVCCGDEAEFSVDLTAPTKPGRYTSYWCLASPCVREIGQTVRVTVQVVPQGGQYPMLQELVRGEFFVEKPSDNAVEEDNVVNMNTKMSSLEWKLEYLRSMGCTNRKLNTSLLKKNQENMRLTRDDLRIAAGWDGVFRDFQKMRAY